jgi:hypothetical protein
MNRIDFMCLIFINGSLLLLLSQGITEVNTREWFCFSHLVAVSGLRGRGSQKNEKPEIIS